MALPNISENLKETHSVEQKTPETKQVLPSIVSRWNHWTNYRRFWVVSVLASPLVSVPTLIDAQQTFISIFADVHPKWHCNLNTTCSPKSNICQLPKSAWSWVDSSHKTVISEWGLECASSIIMGLPASSFFIGWLENYETLASWWFIETNLIIDMHKSPQVEHESRLHKLCYFWTWTLVFSWTWIRVQIYSKLTRPLTTYKSIIAHQNAIHLFVNFILGLYYSRSGGLPCSCKLMQNMIQALFIVNFVLFFFLVLITQTWSLLWVYLKLEYKPANSWAIVCEMELLVRYVVI